MSDFIILMKGKTANIVNKNKIVYVESSNTVNIDNNYNLYLAYFDNHPPMIFDSIKYIYGEDMVLSIPFSIETIYGILRSNSPRTYSK